MKNKTLFLLNISDAAFGPDSSAGLYLAMTSADLLALDPLQLVADNLAGKGKNGRKKQRKVYTNRPHAL